MAKSSRDEREFSTLRMIAGQLGLHVSTVSRVLNSTSESARRAASQQTADRIRSLAYDLGYMPNPHARNLRSRHSGEVAVLVPRVSDLVLANIYEAIQLEASRHGLQSFVVSTYDDPGTHDLAIQSMIERRVEGVIIADSRLDRTYGDALRRAEVPAVCVSRRASDLRSVTCDDLSGGALAAEHLLERGHTRVAVVAGQFYASTGVDRTRGFCDRFEKYGHPVSPSSIKHSSFDAVGGRNALDALADHLPDITAIFAVNDFTAIGVMGALRDRQVVVGRDVAVAGFNDISLARDLPISLTTVRSPMQEMGRRACQLLIELMAGKVIASEKLKPVLEVRQSTEMSVGTSARPKPRRRPQEHAANS